MKRYQELGLDGLKTKAGQGRLPILGKKTDLAAVRHAVQQNRQRVSLAKAELQQELGKEFSTQTLTRFLKKRWPLQAHSTSLKHQPNKA